MIQNIKVSVIIPVYNTEQYLRECLDSVFSQTLKEIEVIAVDDGSTDGSLSILKQYKAKYPNMIVISQKNSKQGAARNAGLKVARGETVLFVDSDDYLCAEALEKLYSCLSTNNLDMVIYDAWAFVECTKEYLPKLYNRNACGINKTQIYNGIDFWNRYYEKGAISVSPCLFFYSTEFLRKYKFYFQEQVFYEDNEFAVKSYIKAKRMMYLNEKLYYRRYRDGSTVRSKYTTTHLKGMIRSVTIIWEHISEAESSLQEQSSFLSFLAGVIGRMTDMWKEMDYYIDGEIAEEWNTFLSVTEKCAFDDTVNVFLYENVSELLELMLKYHLPEAIKINALTCTLSKWERLIYSNVIGDNQNICVYGVGMVGDIILKILEKLGFHRDKIVCAVTKKENEQSFYKGYPLIEITEVDKQLVDVIVIASTKYRDEMICTVKSLYANKYRISTV